MNELQRPTWGNRIDFVLASIGYAVGLGNIWRFPYLCYTSGGGAFLIPYFLTLVVIGIPLLLMETTIGQYTRRGPVGAFRKLCPVLGGTGWSICVMTLIFCLYYNVIIAWAVYYLYISLTSIASGELPWKYCDPSLSALTNCYDQNSTIPHANSISPSEEFFYHKVLQVSSGIDNMASFRQPLVLCLAIGWLLVYLAIFRGIRWSGKVVYFTALFPYLILITLLVWSAMLPGAGKGALYFIRPKFEQLKDPQVWLNAAIQNFNSIGIAFGSLIAFSSYNHFNTNFVRDSITLVLVNSLTSLISGFVVFCALGYISLKQNKDIEDAVTDGSGLVFIVYPAAFTEIKGSVYWSCAFFFMLILLGIDSIFASFEVIVTTLEDTFPFIHARVRREVLCLVLCCLSFLCGLPLVMQGGYYVFELLNYYSSGISLMYIAFFEVIAAVWCYGYKTLAGNFELMTGHRMWKPVIWAWAFVAPTFLVVSWIVTWINAKLSFRNSFFTYPSWAVAIGWMIAAASLVPIPLVACYTMFHAPVVSSQTWYGKLTQKLKHSLHSPLRHEREREDGKTYVQTGEITCESPDEKGLTTSV